jgi:hypothetical protein
MVEEPTPASVLESLVELRQELRGELEGLLEKRGGLERELEGLDKEIESKGRMLELVEATEEQLAAQGLGHQASEEGAPGAGMQVRGLTSRAGHQRARVANLWLVSVL